MTVIERHGAPEFRNSHSHNPAPLRKLTKFSCSHALSGQPLFSTDKIAAMPTGSFQFRSGQSLSAYEILFFLALFLFVGVVCIWPILAWRIHHFSTWVPDSGHSFVVHERGATFYLSPALGRFYVSLPWLWGSLLGATILTGFLTGKKPGGSK